MKSLRLSRLVRGGDDEVDEVGDGGPKLEAGISVWGEGEVIDGEMAFGEGTSGEGRFWMDMRWDCGISGVLCCEVLETDGVGGTEGVCSTDGVGVIADVDATEDR